MLRKKKRNLEWLEFELFQQFPRVAHGIFLRHGGVSTGTYHSLNMGGSTGDDERHIRINRNRARKILQCGSFASVHQVHGSHVIEASLTSGDQQADGLFTKKSDVGLMIKHADCQAAIFYDPTHDVIANVHAGWRGNVQNIYLETVEQLKHRYGCRPQNLFVGISPSLGPCCAQFINYQTELPRPFWDYQVRPLYFDLWEIARRQLLDAGILPTHLQIASICTRCNPDDYFSYRREKVRGSHATVIALRAFF
jgi:polyphenol oxidase